MTPSCTLLEQQHSLQRQEQAPIGRPVLLSLLLHEGEAGPKLLAKAPEPCCSQCPTPRNAGGFRGAACLGVKQLAAN